MTISCLLSLQLPDFLFQFHLLQLPADDHIVKFLQIFIFLLELFFGPFQVPHNPLVLAHPFTKRGIQKMNFQLSLLGIGDVNDGAM